MRPVFSNISYFFKIKSTFFYLPNKFSDCVNDEGFAFLQNIMSQFDFKVVWLLLKICQFLSFATGFFVFLTLFGIRKSK